MNISIDQLKKLRQDSGAGISDCRQALEDAGGNIAKAKELLKATNLKKAAKKEGRETHAGCIESYVHANGNIGVLVEVLTETDFVARNDEFKKLAHEIALQIAAMNPKNVKELLASEYIRDSKLKISDLVKLTIGKVGENIIITRFTRFSLGA